MPGRCLRTLPRRSVPDSSGMRWSVTSTPIRSPSRSRISMAAAALDAVRTWKSRPKAIRKYLRDFSSSSTYRTAYFR